MPSPVMNEVFQINKCSYNLRNPRILTTKHKWTMKYGITTINFKSLQIWQDIPLDIRNSESISLFKSNTKQMQSVSYCCKIY